MATELEQYIRQAAAARGIDPDIAVRVARSEGGLNDPTRQSDVNRNGQREPSYGPFQLLVGGGNTGFPEGMGNAALRAGIDPRDPASAFKAVDFALDGARNNGWGAWYGAKAQGITGKMGINGPGGGPVVFPDGAKGQEVAPPPLTAGKPVNDYPVANPRGQSIDVAGQGAPAAESGLSRIFAALAPAAGQMQPAAPQGGPTQSSGSGDPMGATIAAAQAAQKGRGLASGLMPDIAGLMGLGKRPGAALA